MNPLLSAAGDYLAQKNLELQFRRLIGQARRRQMFSPTQQHALTTQGRAVLERAIQAGLVERLKPGVVDQVVSTPELAHVLMEHGAVPTNAFLDTINRLSCVMSTPARPNNLPQQETSTEAWLTRLVETAADKHPGLDWFQVHPYHPLSPRMLFAFQQHPHFPGLLSAVIKARQREGIVLGPTQATNDTLDALLDDALGPRPHGRTAELTDEEMGWWIAGLLHRGGDANRRIKPHDYMPPLCAVARAMRGRFAWGQVVLDQGATVDEQVLHDILCVMHDQGHPLLVGQAMRANHRDVCQWFEQLLEHSGVALDPDSFVPSTEYGHPTVEQVLSKHYPALLAAVRRHHQAHQLDAATVAGQPGAKLRRF